MILTDDNFATIVKAVELGRGLYDNLTKYIRFQIGVLAGLIITFLGSSIFNVLGGVPFLPLQTLWVNFTTQVFQAIGLGYGKPSEGLMARKPRPSDEQLLPRRLLVWLAVYGLAMGAVTIGVAWVVDDNHGKVLARTMALTTFALANLFFSFECRDERRSIFSLDIFEDRRFLMMSGLSWRDRPRDLARPLRAVPQHRAAELQTVARVHRPGARGRRRRGGPQGVPAPARAERGRSEPTGEVSPAPAPVA
jgi:Ca2+-transporting ATPase